MNFSHPFFGAAHAATALRHGMRRSTGANHSIMQNRPFPAVVSMRSMKYRSHRTANSERLLSRNRNTAAYMSLAVSWLIA